MKRTAILLIITLALTVTGCDFFRRVAGRPVSADIENKRVAILKAEEAAMDEAALRYELAIQTAFSEVRSAYSAYTQEYHRYESLKGAVKAAKDAETISQDLYKNGLSDFNNVLDAQRSLLALEEALTISRGQITQDLISLYKALGGGVTM